MRPTLLLLTAALIPCAVAQTPTVFVAGDSTANNTNHQGWGDPFADYFDSTKINVLNRARAGRSARTFLNEGLWGKIVDEMKPGDYVLIQFGHNDGSAPDQPPYRGDLPGTGPESKDLAMKDGKVETIYTFGWYIRKFIDDTKAKGAHPIVVSLTVRNIWQDGRVERGSGHFSQWLQDVAEAEKVPFVDLTNIIADTYEKLGQDKVKDFFPVDHTHTSPAAADLNARLVVAGLIRRRPACERHQVAPREISFRQRGFRRGRAFARIASPPGACQPGPSDSLPDRRFHRAQRSRRWRGRPVGLG
jgi:rhamnogalacturonan acetylesterase